MQRASAQRNKVKDTGHHEARIARGASRRRRGTHRAAGFSKTPRNHHESGLAALRGRRVRRPVLARRRDRRDDLGRPQYSGRRPLRRLAGRRRPDDGRHVLLHGRRAHVVGLAAGRGAKGAGGGTGAGRGRRGGGFGKGRPGQSSTKTRPRRPLPLHEPPDQGGGICSAGGEDAPRASGRGGAEHREQRAARRRAEGRRRDDGGRAADYWRVRSAENVVAPMASSRDHAAERRRPAQVRTPSSRRSARGMRTTI